MEIIICVGISGAGKSTWATEYLRTTENAIRINRDDVRKGLVGTLRDYYTRSNLVMLEQLTTDISNYMLAECIVGDIDAILDSTHVQQKYVLDILKKYEHDPSIYCRVKFFDIDVETAKERVLERDIFLYSRNHVVYIDKQYQQYLETKKKIELLYSHLIMQ